MYFTPANNLTCPIDGDRLEQHERQLVCKNGHSFDIAKQGYVNLLPVQHKRSKQPGDSKAMVLARSQFLNSGIYRPVADRLTDVVSAHITTDEDICLLDAGCGEGYYTDAVFSSLSGRYGDNNLSLIGLDISKDAIIQSTKRNKQISWLVGTNRQPPVADKSVDIILCLFGFLSIDAFSRLLKPGGKIILLDPGPDHLQELREIIYPEVKTRGADISKQGVEGFSLINSEELRYEEMINSSEKIKQLLIMTPHFYRASKQGREAACQLEKLAITIDVIFRVLKKNDEEN
jgi:23S rRNA (guanine745-N1)-methyltransferase